MDRKNQSEKTVTRVSHTNSVCETAALVLRQHVLDCGGMGVTVTETNDLVVWDDRGSTVAHIHTVTRGEATDKRALTDGGTPTVVADVQGDETNAVTSWSFIAEGRMMDSKAELAHYLNEIAA